MTTKFSARLVTVNQNQSHESNERLLEVLEIFKIGQDTVNTITEARVVKGKNSFYRYSVEVSTFTDIHSIASFIKKYTKHFAFAEVTQL